jgi:FkbM family methyltransferase
MESRSKRSYLPELFRGGFRTYEPKTRSLLIENCKKIYSSGELVFLNIGANTGLWALIISKLFTGSKVILVEPVPENLTVLRENMRLNGVGATILEMAATDEAQTLDMFTHEAYFGLASTKGDATRKISVTGKRIDDLKLPAIGIILIDVEGHEISALKGMLKLISRDNPILIIELSIETLRIATELLTHLGYQEPSHITDKEDFGPGSRNFLFLPSNKNSKQVHI